MAPALWAYLGDAMPLLGVITDRDDPAAQVIARIAFDGACRALAAAGITVLARPDDAPITVTLQD